MQIESVIIKPESLSKRLVLSDWFDSLKTLEIDVGCGKGRFLVSRATTYPETCFLGVDRMLKRIRKTDKKILRTGLKNVRLVRMEAAYLLQHLLPNESVSVFYIFFPDPWPKRRHHKHRLFSNTFVLNLHRTLVNSGVVHFASDHLEYCEAAKKTIVASDLFEEMPHFEPTDDERTEFETIFREQNLPIGRFSFRKK